MEEAKALLYIIRSYIKNKKCNNQFEIDEEKMYRLAKLNKVSNFLQNWCKDNASEEIKKKVNSDYNAQILSDTNENFELEKILTEFEKAGIDILVVKGITMKDVYPQEYMRQMCDIDVMVREKNFKRASNIMKELGFSQFYDHEKHLVFEKAPLILVEMHRKLIPGGEVGSKYFNEIWPNCISYGKYKNVYRMNIDDSYIFCILHLMRHFQYAGIEVRDILDVYLYYEKYKDLFDKEKIQTKFEEFGLTEFEKNIRNIAYKWFGDDEITAFDDVEKFILGGSNAINMVNYSVGKNDGKVNYIFKLLFPSYSVMKEKYPVLKKAPVLLPVMWGVRLVKDIFSKETTVKERLDTIKLIQDVKQEDVDEIQRIYEKLGIGKE